MSAPTAATANPKPAPAELDGPFASLLERARKMTPAKKKALLISAGILIADGELEPHDRSKAAVVKKVLADK